MANNVQFGLSNVHIAKMNADGTYGTIREYDLPVNLSLEHQSNLQDFFAGNNKVASVETDQGFSGSLEGMYFPDWFLTEILNQVVDDDGAILQGGGEKSSYFALGFQFEGDENATRVWACKCKATPPKGSHQTTDEGVNADHETIDISATSRTFTEGSGSSAQTWKYAVSIMRDKTETHAAYESYFDAVPHAVMSAEAEVADTKLASLTIGTLRLDPSFKASTTEYEASTTSSTVAVTAITRDEDATVAIKNGSTTVTNGGSASLSAGENTITVTVTNGTEERVYTVIVTKS
jgi:phi13 family phage major tail protein